MENNFKVVSLSYKKAPLQIRELISLNEQACRNLLHLLRDYTTATDVLALSTCNRTEVYYSSEDDLSNEIIRLIGIQNGITNIAEYAGYFNCINDAQEATRHLFYVSIGLESQVVGDMQISNQVKRSYQMSADEDMAGPFLHRLMHATFFTSKKIVQQTSFRDGAASVSYAAAELIDELTGDFQDPSILIVGLGEIGADVCKNLLNFNKQKVTITNRTEGKAIQLAAECNFNAVPFEQVEDAMKEADVIICAVSSQQPFITKETVARHEVLSHKFFIDLAVPRSIDPDIEEVPGILLYNIDDIHHQATAALEKRKAAIPAVKEIIAESIEEFNNWAKEMMVSPTIQKFKNALEQIRQEELTRYLKNLNEEEAKALDKVTRSMMQKIIKLPVLQLKAACKRGEAENLIDVLNDLFNLEKQSASTPEKE